MGTGNPMRPWMASDQSMLLASQYASSKAQVPQFPRLAFQSPLRLQHRKVDLGS